MVNFNRGNSSRGGDRRGGGGGFDRRGGGDRRERPTMHDAICDDCGKKCEVPFKPSGDKPVYCNSCFGREESNFGNDRRGGDRRDGGDRFDRRGGDRRDGPRMHKAICDECGEFCEVPFKPSGDKPVYCNNCFGKGDGAASNKPNQSNLKHDEINAKLDTILILLQRITTGKEAVKSKSAVNEVKKAVEEIVAEKETKKVKKVAASEKDAKKAPAKKTVMKAAGKKKTK